MRYFIVTNSELLYYHFVRENALDPNKVWLCKTEEEADKDIANMREKKIRAMKIVIPKSFEDEHDEGPKQLSLGI